MKDSVFNEKRYWCDFVEGQIGYVFKNKDLLQQAFIRKSYSMEKGGENNEVLEFIGDKALDVIVVKILAEYYGYMASEDDDNDNEYDEFCCGKSEGKLTHLKSLLVRKQNLSSRIDDLDLASYLIMGKGDLENKVDREASVKEDLFESIVGAITIDSDWDFDEIQEAVEVMLCPEMILDSDSIEENYIKLIQEWLTKHHNDIPQFVYEEKNSYESIRTGSYPNAYYSAPKVIYYDEKRSWNNYYGNSQFKYECRMKLTDNLPEFGAYGESKSEARWKVCECAYKYLEQEDLLWTIQDEIENPNKNEAISQLEILARRGYFSLPKYEYFEEHDNNGNPKWKVECHIEEVEYYFDAESSSKKNAKKEAAFDMLKYVLYGDEDE
ncbi:MAG: hypothetical protein K6G88_04560 [Lachnospiraceae bacterium]|nr:hypothetical protein [Lachnospiraceae bacterium]